ncbi:hypothetical protein LPB136_13580 [Tenacibaculum todarodis]|uniref:OmpA-like domain-containing protein n=1 Tax=Tenacibaculum todarodis TaxID=1850252 RepID=A0A1L3JMM7_9FLAO|nr:OmpA family protein [Tenacibaculum todarodis]APG63866.1 hypothetical protein LPB136_00105 [Tenacibaculum todarodis]APG66339.1 hypothetical protein LPB136_13580 [Tenacibaculum todarodis]
MKKIVLLLVVVFCTMTEANAQEFNQWSIDLGVGVHKPVFPLSSGYGTDTPDFWQANIGGRYMINEKFGLRVDFGFNQFSEADGGKPFDTDYYRGTIEGVVNAGEILGFRDWTQRINLLIHGGVGLSDLKAYQPNAPKDRMINVVFGVTPQVKLTDRVALFLDASVVGHLYQNISFDGNGRTSRNGFNGGLFNASVGLNIYLGKEKTHADWYVESNEPTVEETNELTALENRLKTAEAKIAKLTGVKSDYNKAALVTELDNRYSKKGKTTVAPKVDFIKELLNKGYENVYFDFGKSTIQKYSLEAVNYVAKYLTENPSTKVELTGYADELGSTNSNQSLSTKRAKKVYDVLVAAGISSNRLSYNGKGEDTSVNKNSEEARQLVRRVSFTIK